MKLYRDNPREKIEEAERYLRARDLAHKECAEKIASGRADLEYIISSGRDQIVAMGSEEPVGDILMRMFAAFTELELLEDSIVGFYRTMYGTNWFPEGWKPE